VHFQCSSVILTSLAHAQYSLSILFIISLFKTLLVDIFNHSSNKLWNEMFFFIIYTLSFSNQVSFPTSLFWHVTFLYYFITFPHALELASILAFTSSKSNSLETPFLFSLQITSFVFFLLQKYENNENYHI